MIEQEWEGDPHLFDLLRFFKDSVSNRRLRLFGCACCRRNWHLLCREGARRCVELAEAFANGEVTETHLRAAYDHPDFTDLQPQLRGEVGADAQLSLCGLYALSAARRLAMPNVDVLNIVLATSYDLADDYFPTLLHNEVIEGGGIRCDVKELDEKEKLVRDIFGNPFRSTIVNPSWRTEHTIGIASMMYADRDFSAMPILVDALLDAGCDNDDILSHCRGGGPHVRGCFVVDMILGKE